MRLLILDTDINRLALQLAHHTRLVVTDTEPDIPAPHVALESIHPLPRNRHERRAADARSTRG